MKEQTTRWYRAKEAKKGRIAHLAGHCRKGPGFSKCGKTLGQEVTNIMRGRFPPLDACANCGLELGKEEDRREKRDAIAKRAEQAPAESPTEGWLKTPELDKLAAVKKESQAIGEFLDWLGDQKGAILATTHIHGPDCLGWDKERGKFNPAKIEEEYCRLGPDGRLWGYSKRTEDLLAEFFEIDLAKCEAERRAILARIRGKA